MKYSSCLDDMAKAKAKGFGHSDKINTPMMVKSNGWSMAHYIPIRSDGQPSKLHKYYSIPWKFCPICGKAITENGCEKQ